jgi:hypothetical protein
MTVLLGDPIRYSLSGSIRQTDETKDGAVITAAEVAVACKGFEKSLYQNRKGLTDLDGHYLLRGYGVLEGCSIVVSHRDYEPVNIVIDESHLVRREGLSRTYEVNILLLRRAHGR